MIHRYRFPPQDHAIDRALEVRDPRTQKSAGDLIAIDDHDRTIDLKRGATSSVPHPTALIPFDIVDSEVLRSSLLRVASAVADSGMVGQGMFQAARDLLLRRGPRSLEDMAGPLIGADGCLTESARQLVRSLVVAALRIADSRSTRIGEDIQRSADDRRTREGWPKGWNHGRQPQGHHKPSARGLQARIGSGRSFEGNSEVPMMATSAGKQRSHRRKTTKLCRVP